LPHLVKAVGRPRYVLVSERELMKGAGCIGLVCILVLSISCSGERVVNYETVQSFKPAQGSIMMGFSSQALNNATKLSEVRQKCGTPIGEWEENIPFFARVKRLRYKAYDVHSNVLTATFTFLSSRSDPPLIDITENQTPN
jgi:hypothetical protein